MTRPGRKCFLLLGCAAAALVLPGTARAQGFAANPVIAAGSVDISRTPGTDLITVNSPSAIIDWFPFGRFESVFQSPLPDPYIFLPQGNFGIFQNGANNSNFAVLNRIVPVGASRMQFDGTVISRLQTAAGTVPGGTIVFSSPTGIIIGRTAVFDVGNLLLTSLTVMADGNGQFFVDGRFQLRGGENNPNSAVVTEAGASLTALSEGSWIALVAPRVEHAGTLRVNGSAAYVAGEAVDLRIDQGLFDINVLVGSDQATPLIHSGTTGGPASGRAGDAHAIYMVAAPKNQAITALLSGSVGFDAATSAAVENGVIVLSAGHNVVNGAIDPAPLFAQPASFLITGGRLSSDVTGRATTDFIAGGTGVGALTFEQGVSLSAYGRAQLLADQGYQLRVEGNAILSAANLQPVFLGGGGSDITGGEASIVARSGGRVQIAGNATVDASAVGGVGETFAGGTGTGGTAAVTSDKAAVEIGGSLTMLATGTGATSQQFPASQGGNGVGGTARASALNGGTLRVGGDIVANAAGTGSAGIDGPGTSGTGGTAAVAAASGGAVRIGGNVNLAAAGAGGSVDASSVNPGGNGQGGTAALTAAGGAIELVGGGSLAADGTGGTGANGGAGRGGTASVTAAEGAVTAGAALQLQANGTGGNATASGGRGGDGVGGTVSATADAANGRLALGPLTGRSIGTGGNGGASGRGGNGSGGNLTAGTVSGAQASAATGSATFAAVDLRSEGTGGGGASGGVVSAGTVTLAANAAPVTVSGRVDLNAVATGGSGIIQGTAVGGELIVSATSGATLAAGALSGATVAVGDGGSGNVLGRWRVLANGSAVSLGSADLRASATGTPSDLTASDIRLLNGTVEIAGAGTFGSDGEVRVIADGAGRLTGGDIALASRTGIGISHTNRAAGTLTVDAATFSARTAGNYTASAGTAVTGRNGVVIEAGQAATLHQTTSGGAISVAAGTIATLAGPIAAQQVSVAAQDIVIPAGASVDAGAGTALLDARRNYSAAAGTLVRGGAVDIRAGADASLGETRATGEVSVAAGGNVTLPTAVAGQQVFVAGQDITIAGGGSVDAGAGTALLDARRNYAAAGAVRGGAVDIRAGADAQLGQTSATGALSVTAGGMARFGAAAVGRGVTVTSADIDLQAGGSLGNAGTDFVALRPQPGANPTVLGGASQAAGYTLTQDEAARIRAGVLRVAPLAGQGSADVIVRNLSLAGSGAGVSAFEVAAPGSVRVEGALLLGGAGAADRIGITAGGRVEVVTGGGSIRVRDAAGAPGGSLSIAAADIWVTDAALGGQLAADPNFAGRDAALRANGGADAPRGFVEAGTVRLAPGRTLFVQNSGNAVSFAGITVGAGGLTIVPSGEQPAAVYAFGRRLNPDGSFTTNIAFFRQVDFSRGQSAGYTDQSEFNRCIINTGLCGSVFGGSPPGSGRDPIRGPGLFPLPPAGAADDLIDASAFAAAPLIEEPVTSGADSTLWTDPEEDDDEDDKDEEQ